VGLDGGVELLETDTDTFGELALLVLLFGEAMILSHAFKFRIRIPTQPTSQWSSG
jgi:hypothetical protein